MLDVDCGKAVYVQLFQMRSSFFNLKKELFNVELYKKGYSGINAFCLREPRFYILDIVPFIILS